MRDVIKWISTPICETQWRISPSDCISASGFSNLVKIGEHRNALSDFYRVRPSGKYEAYSCLIFQFGNYPKYSFTALGVYLGRKKVENPHSG